jgi:hypothetical protein
MESRKKKIHIIAVESGNEAHAIRTSAEVWGASVIVTWVGNSQQIVDDLSNLPNAELIILSAHGNAKGLLLPTLDQEVARQFPYNQVITPNNFGEFLALQDNIIINTACLGGTLAMASVFLNQGANT